MLPQQVPPTPSPHVQTTELGLADGTGAVHDLATEDAVLRPRRGKLLAGLAIAMVAVVGGVYAMTRPSRPSGSPSVTAAAAAPVAPQQHVTVAPIPPSEQDLAPGSAVVVAIAGSATAELPTPAAPSEPPPTEAHKKPVTEPAHVRHPHHVASLEPKRSEPLTRDAVAAKLRAVKHEYDVYKAKNGGRLENEWNDLATFMNYQLRADNLDEASRRIDAFRAKMKE